MGVATIATGGLAMWTAASEAPATPPIAVGAIRSDRPSSDGRNRRREIIDILFRSQAERSATLILVTHDPALAGRCNRVLHMRSGRIETPAHPTSKFE